jgi:hypothetical protein
LRVAVLASILAASSRRSTPTGCDADELLGAAEAAVEAAKCAGGDRFAVADSLVLD